MALTVTLRYNSNTRVVGRHLPRTGDITECVYDVVVDAGPNAYPAGGEPISFAAQFREVHAVECTPAFDLAAAGQATAGALIPAFQRAAAPNNLNQGVIRFFATGAAANARLNEFPAGAYPAEALAFQIVVHGRPASDAS